MIESQLWEDWLTTHDSSEARQHKEQRAKTCHALVGQIIMSDRYRIIDLVGMGQYGAVYRVVDQRPNEDNESGGRFRSANDEYALKILIPARSVVESGDSPRVRFGREYRMGRRNLSPSGRIAKTYDYFIAQPKQPPKN